MQRANVVETNLDFTELTNRACTDMIVIHHTGNPTDDDMSAEEIHRSHQNKGWAGIGYHYVIRKDGTVERGRPHWTVGAHAYGYNSHTIGIHLSGNFMDAQPTGEQIEALAMLLSGVCSDYDIPINSNTVVGHCDLMSTDCPGTNLYSLLEEVRGKANWYQQN